MRLRAETAALAAEAVRAALCTLPAHLQCMRAPVLGSPPAPFPTGLHAANAVINSRKKSEFPLFSSMSFCRPASIAKGNERMQGVCKDCC